MVKCDWLVSSGHAQLEENNSMHRCGGNESEHLTKQLTFFFKYRNKKNTNCVECVCFEGRISRVDENEM